MSVRALDLFCGGGGSSWGAEAAGATVVGGIDAWEVATQTFASNFPHARAIQHRLSERTDPKALGNLGRIDLLLASPECTNHTCARGSRPRDEESRRTARYVLNFVSHFRPRWLVLENVVSMRGWDGYGELVSEISVLGYGVRAQVMDAADFGTPQTRRRLFLMCEQGRTPQPIDVRRSAKALPARAILSPPGSFPVAPLEKEGRAKATLARAHRAIDALGRGKPFLIVYYGSDGSGGWQPLSRPLRTLTTLDRFGLVTWAKDQPMLRMLQPVELCRAMGFDRVEMSRSYALDHGTRRDRVKLLGNGVCPTVMRTVVSHLTGERAGLPETSGARQTHTAAAHVGVNVG